MSIAKVNNQIITTLNKVQGNNFYALDSYTKLLLKFNGTDGAKAYTAETGQTVTFAGTAQLDTAQKRFGASSLLLDGNSDYVTVPDSDDWYFGTGDFTIDCWVRFTGTITDYATIFNVYNDPAYNYFRLSFGVNDTLQKLRAHVVNGGVFDIQMTTNIALVADTWQHIALVRSEDTLKLFLNGLEVASANFTENYSIANFSEWFTVGFNNANRYFGGWIDMFRVSKGIARWTSNFTPPIDIAKINGITV